MPNRLKDSQGSKTVKNGKEIKLSKPKLTFYLIKDFYLKYPFLFNLIHWIKIIFICFGLLKLFSYIYTGNIIFLKNPLILLSCFIGILEGGFIALENLGFLLTLTDNSKNFHLIDNANKNLNETMTFMDNKDKIKWYYTEGDHGYGLRIPENYKVGNNMTLIRWTYIPFKENQILQLIFDVTFDKTPITPTDLKRILRANCYDKETCKYILRTYTYHYRPEDKMGYFIKQCMYKTIDKVFKTKN